MKYIIQADGNFSQVDESSELFKAIKALPKDRQPALLSKNAKEVAEFLNKQDALALAAKKRVEDRQSALAKLAKVASLTDEELATL